jgi:post-segregation antitoxin (ccd killing protein)
MKSSPHSQVHKCPVNLTLSEDLVLHARQLTHNLSGIVEALLTEYVEREQQRRHKRSQQVETTIVLWNAFEERYGAFADEYSTL